MPNLDGDHAQLTVSRWNKLPSGSCREYHGDAQHRKRGLQTLSLDVADDPMRVGCDR